MLRGYTAVLAAAVLCYAALGAVLRILPGLASTGRCWGCGGRARADRGAHAARRRPLGRPDGPGARAGRGRRAMAAGVVPALLDRGSGALLASRLRSAPRRAR